MAEETKAQTHPQNQSKAEISSKSEAEPKVQAVDSSTSAAGEPEAATPAPAPPHSVLPTKSSGKHMTQEIGKFRIFWMGIPWTGI